MPGSFLDSAVSIKLYKALCVCVCVCVSMHACIYPLRDSKRSKGLGSEISGMLYFVLRFFLFY